MQINNNKVLRLGILLLIFTILGSCGGRLRGLSGDVKDLPPVNLQGEDVRFLSELAQAFRQQGFDIADDNRADWIINITDYKFSRRLSAVNQSGQATSFLLSLTIQFQISKNTDSPDETTQAVTASQDLLYDQTAVLGKDAEEEIIHQSLLGDTAQQIIYRYRAAAKQ